VPLKPRKATLPFAPALSVSRVFHSSLISLFIAWKAGLGAMSRENRPETEGSPGAPQSSTTFHQVMPIIGPTLNQVR
jgi:hypothetical protein